MTPLCCNGNGGRATKMVFCLLLFLIPITLSIDKSDISHQTQEVQNQLKRLNKPAQKSIESPDGDIIDCVNIKLQPAFDHPLLKNHTIQAAPNFHEESKASSNARPITQLWHLNGECPEETIPMRRIKEEDILRASSFESYKREEHPSVVQPSSIYPNDPPKIRLVKARGVTAGGRCLGGKANINVWKPQVEREGEFSSSHVSIIGSPETIKAGWQVNPRLYGDGNPRLFGYWTTTFEQSTGCYDLLCSGFVQLDNKIALGATISPVSEYNGTQYQITISIQKDDGNWGLYYGKGRKIGYWPGSLFTSLKTSATNVAWEGQVGFVGSNTTHTATQMGSGHFPSEGFGRAAFFSHLEVFGDSKLPILSSREVGCYEIQVGQINNLGVSFFYGGPGRSATCLHS